jgi:zinc transporter ZupT
MEVAFEANTLSQVVTMTALPAASMAFGSFAMNWGKPSERLQSQMQYFSGGLLIGAVIAEIFPILKQHLVDSEKRPDVKSCLAAGAGFMLALFVMYGMKSLVGENEHEDEGQDEPVPRATPSYENNLSEPLLNSSLPCVLFGGGRDEAKQIQTLLHDVEVRAAALQRLASDSCVDHATVDEEVDSMRFLVRASLRDICGADVIEDLMRLVQSVDDLRADVKKLAKTESVNLPAVQNSLQNLLMSIDSIRDNSKFWKSLKYRGSVVPKLNPECDIESALPASCPPENTPRPTSLPRTLFAGVVVDSCVDGMLIGLSASVVPESGWLMAIATAIEMCFLGFSFACALRGKTSPVATFITLAVPPMAMLVASCTAWIGAYWVEHSFVFAGLVAFALVALLFLVLQELLLEAREKEDGQLWQVSMWLYIGLFLSLFLDIFL